MQRACVLEEEYFFIIADHLVLWVSGCDEGNPPRSIDVINLIRHLKKMEVQKQGVLSKAKMHPLTEAEF